jgi:hypothetical protein
MRRIEGIAETVSRQSTLDPQAGLDDALLLEDDRHPAPGPEPPSDRSTATRPVQVAGPPGRPGPLGSGADHPAPVRPHLRAGARCPAGLGGAGPVPVGIAVVCPTSLSMGAVAAAPTAARAWAGGRQAMPAPQRLPCLLLHKVAADLASQQLHLVGEPGRPWSWPSTPAAAPVGGGPVGRWLGPRIGWYMHGSVLAPPSGLTTWLARVAQRSRAARARWNSRRGGSASVRSLADHPPFTRSAARSPSIIHWS